MRSFKTYRTTTDSKAYKHIRMIDIYDEWIRFCEGRSSKYCRFCKRKHNCYTRKKYNVHRNWKHYRKTQYKNFKEES